MTKRLNEIIDQIRREEREKILKELKVKETEGKVWKRISSRIESWGKEYNKTPWEMSQIKNSIYTLIRYSLNIKHMGHLREEQFELALQITDEILNILEPWKEEE